MPTDLKQHQNATANCQRQPKEEDSFNVLLVAFCFLFPALLAVWYALDNSWPCWDAADHVRVEFQYADLLKHARPWNGHWLKEFLTVNYCYPPSVHIFNGGLKAIFGDGRWVDALALTIFSTILSFSTCATGLLLLKSRKAAAAGVALIQAYPVVALLSHEKLLDYPHLALYSLAMTSLLWWQKQPSWGRSILCGAALALACTTKQIAAFFLFAPCLVVLVQQLKAKDYARSLQLTVSGLMVVALLAVWVLPNWHDIYGYMHRNTGHLGGRTLWVAFVENLSGYLNCLPGLFGYPLLLLSGMSLALATKAQLRTLALFAISAVVGIACMCSLQFQLPEHRYIAPALLFPALLCAAQLSRWFSDKNLLPAVTAGGLFIFGLLQFIVMNYAPYPIPLPKPVMQSILLTDTERRGPLEPGFNPTPPGDQWGQQWVVREAKAAVNNAPCWLNMLPSTPELSVHTLSLVSRYEGSNVRITTPRLWTPTGDKIDFDETAWKNFSLYVVKTGAQGLQFESPQSARNYELIEQKLRSGNDYKLAATRSIADGSILRMYIRNDLAQQDKREAAQ